MEELVTWGTINKRKCDNRRSKFRYKNLECNYYHKMQHIKADCFKLKIKLKQKEKYGDKNIETAENRVATDESNKNIFLWQMIGQDLKMNQF